MRDISLHVLDIVMNSIHANASLVKINFEETNEVIKFEIEDDGRGMSQETLEKIGDPFYTTRNTRNVGLGIPLLSQNVQKTNGSMHIQSEVNQGTTVTAVFNKNHIDCIPLGDINETILSLIMLEPQIDYIYTYKKKNECYELNTKEIKAVLDDVPINSPEVLNWLKIDLGN